MMPLVMQLLPLSSMIVQYSLDWTFEEPLQVLFFGDPGHHSNAAIVAVAV